MYFCFFIFRIIFCSGENINNINNTDGIKNITNSNFLFSDLSKYTSIERISNLVKNTKYSHSFENIVRHSILLKNEINKIKIDGNPFEFNLQDTEEQCIKRTVDFINNFYMDDLKIKIKHISEQLTLKDVVKLHVNDIEFNENELESFKAYTEYETSDRILLALGKIKNKVDLCDYFNLFINDNAYDNYIKGFCTILNKVQEELNNLNKTNDKIQNRLIFDNKEGEDLRTFFVNFVYYVTFYDVCEKYGKIDKNLHLFHTKTYIYDLNTKYKPLISNLDYLKHNILLSAESIIKIKDLFEKYKEMKFNLVMMLD